MTTPIPQTCELAIPFIQKIHSSRNNAQSPTFVLLSGTQGIGKSTLSTTLNATLPNLHITSISIDDFYFPYEDLQRISRESNNPLYEFRGYPGTHDTELLIQVLQNLNSQLPCKIPIYDKSQRNGKGDRVGYREISPVPRPYDIVILDGWCLGFKALEETMLKDVFDNSKKLSSSYKFDDLLQINVELARFDRVHEFFGVGNSCVVQLLPENGNLKLVYKWRIAQEEAMKSKNGGVGMSEEEVMRFVDRYMAGYIIYLLRLTDGFYSTRSENDKRHLRMELNSDWKVVKAVGGEMQL